MCSLSRMSCSHSRCSADVLSTTWHTSARTCHTGPSAPPQSRPAAIAHAALPRARRARVACAGPCGLPTVRVQQHSSLRWSRWGGAVSGRALQAGPRSLACPRSERVCCTCCATVSHSLCWWRSRSMYEMYLQGNGPRRTRTSARYHGVRARSASWGGAEPGQGCDEQAGGSEVSAAAEALHQPRAQPVWRGCRREGSLVICLLLDRRLQRRDPRDKTLRVNHVGDVRRCLLSIQRKPFDSHFAIQSYWRCLARAVSHGPKRTDAESAPVAPAKSVFDADVATSEDGASCDSAARGANDKKNYIVRCHETASESPLEEGQCSATIGNWPHRVRSMGQRAHGCKKRAREGRHHNKCRRGKPQRNQRQKGRI